MVQQEEVELTENQDPASMPVLINWKGNSLSRKRYSLVRGSFQDCAKVALIKRKKRTRNGGFCQEECEKCRVYHWKEAPACLAAKLVLNSASQEAGKGGS